MPFRGGLAGAQLPDRQPAPVHLGTVNPLGCSEP
jgi:hypothetical protein